MTSELMVENVVLQNTQSFLLLIEEKIGEKKKQNRQRKQKAYAYRSSNRSAIIVNIS